MSTGKPVRSAPQLKNPLLTDKDSNLRALGKEIAAMHGKGLIAQDQHGRDVAFYIDTDAGKIYYHKNDQWVELNGAS